MNCNYRKSLQLDLRYVQDTCASGVQVLQVQLHLRKLQDTCASFMQVLQVQLYLR